MRIEITISKEELGKLGHPTSARVKSFIWDQVASPPEKTGEAIDLNMLDLDVEINVV